MNAKLVESDSPERGVILLWCDQKRIIAHFDVLKRLFEGVLTQSPEQIRRSSRLGMAKR
jgi:hypothetical protein